MNIYLLEKTNKESLEYGEATGMVVRAENEKIARWLADDEISDPVWLDSRIVTCKQIGVAFGQSNDGVILIHFRLESDL